MTKLYPWADLRRHASLEALFGAQLRLERPHSVDPRRFPAFFRNLLDEDGFDLTRRVIVQAALVDGAFGIRVDQE